MLEAKFANPVLASHVEEAEPYHRGEYTETYLLPASGDKKVAVTFLSGKSRDERSRFNFLHLDGITEWHNLFIRMSREDRISGVIMADSTDPSGKLISPGIYI